VLAGPFRKNGIAKSAKLPSQQGAPEFGPIHSASGSIGNVPPGAVGQNYCRSGPGLKSLPPTEPLPLRKVTVSADKLTASKVKITKDFSEYLALISKGFGLPSRKKYKTVAKAKYLSGSSLGRIEYKTWRVRASCTCKLLHFYQNLPPWMVYSMSFEAILPANRPPVLEGVRPHVES